MRSCRRGGCGCRAGAGCRSIARREPRRRGNNVGHPTGARPAELLAGRARRATPTAIAKPVSRPADPLRQQPDLQRRRQNLFSENGVTQWGFVWGQFLDHTFGLREAAGGEHAPIAFDADRPARGVRQRPRRDRRSPHAGRARARAPAHVRASRSTRSRLHRRLERLRRHRRAARVAARGPGRRRHGQQRRHAAAARAGCCRAARARGNAAARARDGARRSADRPAREAMVAGDVRANENIALTATHTLFAREHNRIVARCRPTCPRSRSSRSPGGSSSPSSSTSPTRVPPALGVAAAAATAATSPSVNATPRQRVRHRRLPRAQHDPRRVRAGRARRHVHGRAARRRSRRRASRSSRGRRQRRARGPAQRRVLQPRPAREPSARRRCCRRSAARREYRNDEQIDNQLRSVLFQVPGPGIPNPSVCLDGPRCRTCFTGVVDLGAIDIERGRDHGMPRYNELRRAYGLRAEDVVHRDHRRGDRPVPGRRRRRSTTRTSSTSSQLRDIDGDAIAARQRRTASAVDRRPPHHARGPAARRSTATSTSSTRSSAWSPSGTCRAPSSASCSWRSGSSSSEALRDGDRFFYATTPRSRRSSASTGSAPGARSRR